MGATRESDAAVTFLALFPLAGVASCVGLVGYTQWRGHKAVAAFCTEDVVVGAPVDGVERQPVRVGLYVEKSQGFDRGDVTSLSSVSVSSVRWSCAVDFNGDTVLDKHLSEGEGCK